MSISITELKTAKAQAKANKGHASINENWHIEYRLLLGSRTALRPFHNYFQLVHTPTGKCAYELRGIDRHTCHKINEAMQKVEIGE